MRRHGWLRANWVRSKFTAAVVVCCFSRAVPLLAQERSLSGATLPDAPSTAQEYVSTRGSAEHALTFGRRARLYRREMLSLDTIVGPGFGAGVGQWEDEPPGWYQGAEGYGKRFGSGVARHTIAETIRFGFAAVDGEDPRYFPSEDKRFWARAGHAIAFTFVSKTSHGGDIPAFSRFAGIYSAAFIANEWEPANRATAGYAARRGSTALASSVGFHVLREFVPLFRRTQK